MLSDSIYVTLNNSFDHTVALICTVFQEQQPSVTRKAKTEELHLTLDAVVTGKSRLSAARWFTDVIALQVS